jgi:hypothetical protein
MFHHVGAERLAAHFNHYIIGVGRQIGVYRYRFVARRIRRTSMGGFLSYERLLV